MKHENMNISTAATSVTINTETVIKRGRKTRTHDRLILHFDVRNMILMERSEEEEYWGDEDDKKRYDLEFLKHISVTCGRGDGGVSKTARGGKANRGGTSRHGSRGRTVFRICGGME